MSENERPRLLGTATETCAGLRELACRLRRRLPAKAVALAAAVRAERQTFRLIRQLHLALSDPELARRLKSPDS